MRRSFGISLLAAALLLAAVAAQGEVFKAGRLIVSFDGSFTPRDLPRERLAPITVDAKAKIRTVDGGRPPALRRLEIELNSNGRLTTRGLPTCNATSLQSTSSGAALARCRPALVGRGSYRADLDLSQEGLPARGRILIFNARQGGHPGLLLHLYGTVPVQATFVVPLTISHQPGRFGTVLSAHVPNLAGGLGSISSLQMEIGRTYHFRGKRLSYLSASCAAPEPFDFGIFTFAKGTFSFVDGSQLHLKLERDCRVR